jgi:cytochrome c oxidase cbb3-type subunit 3
MSQFSSSFWDVYIAVITLVSVVACGVFLKMQSVRRVAGSGSETTGHTWDEDLGEFNNPLPRWWMWLFYLTIVFALVYLALYPGLGSWKGLLGWSEVGQLKQEDAAAEAKYGPIYEKFAAQDVPSAMRRTAAAAEAFPT